MSECSLQSGAGFPHTGRPCGRCHFGPCPVETESKQRLENLFKEISATPLDFNDRKDHKLSLEESYKATSALYLTALKAAYEARFDPDAVAKIVVDAVAPLAPITSDDLAWAHIAIAQIEGR
jgi:hypothetical protein